MVTHSAKARVSRVKLPYVLNRPDKPGYYFNRRVPKDLRVVVGKEYWRFKLGDGIVEARRNLPDAIAKTDGLIAQLRDGKSLQVATGVVERASTAIPVELDKLLLQGQPANDIYQDPRFFGTPEEAEVVAELPAVDVLSKTPISSQDLINLSLKLKPNSSYQTQLNWQNSLKYFTEFIGHDNLHLVQKNDCRDYRDHLLSTRKQSTTKTILNFLTALFNLAVEDDLITFNPFAGIGKRLSLRDGKRDGIDRKEFDVSQSDQTVNDVLPAVEADLYWCLRWTGCRIAEIAGIKSEDINLEQGLIEITPYDDDEMPRPLKNRHSKRVVPIHPQLLPIITRLKNSSDRPFASLYSKPTKRWKTKRVWGNLIGLHPHALRHNFITTLRDQGVEEYLIGRLVGHQVPGMTSNYGSVSIEKLQEALLKLK